MVRKETHFYVIKTLLKLNMAMIVIYSFNSININGLFGDRTQIFPMIPVGGTGSKNLFVRYYKTNPQNTIRNHLLLQFDEKRSILLGVEKWSYPPPSFQLNRMTLTRDIQAPEKQRIPRTFKVY